LPIYAAFQGEGAVAGPARCGEPWWACSGDDLVLHAGAGRQFPRSRCAHACSWGGAAHCGRLASRGEPSGLVTPVDGWGGADQLPTLSMALASSRARLYVQHRCIGGRLAEFAVGGRSDELCIGLAQLPLIGNAVATRKWKRSP